MDIETFINDFKDVIPYQFKIKMGGNGREEIKKDKNKISASNYKGKIYPIYRTHLTETTIEWVPVENVKLPIDLSVACDYPHRLLFEERPKHTKEDNLKFTVRLLHEKEQKQFGFISIDLNTAGDITHKFCSYYNAEGTRKIMQSCFYWYNEETKEVITNENLNYIFCNLETEMEEKVEFHKRNGEIEGITISKEALRNHAYDSIVWSEEEVERQSYLFARCYSEKLLNKNQINCDVTNDIINNDFTYKRKRIKELRDLMKYEKEKEYQYMFNFRRYKEEIRYLLDPKNDNFRGFVGEYVGNTVIQENGILMLIIETIKEGLHYFTGIDITNTGAFNVDIYREREEGEGEAYYRVMRNASKYPLFRLKIENGVETLIPFNMEISKKELETYNQFKKHCSENFTTLADKKLATLSFKKRNDLVEESLKLKRTKQRNKSCKS